VTGLRSNVSYYVRVAAENDEGVGFYREFIESVRPMRPKSTLSCYSFFVCLFFLRRECNEDELNSNQLKSHFSQFGSVYFCRFVHAFSYWLSSAPYITGGNESTEIHNVFGCNALNTENGFIISSLFTANKKIKILKTAA